MNPASPPAASDGQPAWHALRIEAAETALGSSASGLSDAEAKARLERYGPNTLPEPPRRSLPRIFLAQLTSPLIYLLLAAALAASTRRQLFRRPEERPIVG